MASDGELRPGTLLGRYEVLMGIAEGGMARVWAAKQHGQRGFSKLVAIKTILPTLARDPEFEAMFLDEARVAASVHHPNVCEIFDLGEESGTLYLAMEWVNGDSVARILKPGGVREAQRVNVRVAARIVSDASAGLHAAHELRDADGRMLNVVHRDVSTHNILISIDGNVKVTDFGVAKALGSTHEATMAGQVKGKAAYMSPEQASGGRIDRRSDIFVLGIVLYEMTTGQRPFAAENQVATLRRLLEGRFHPPSALVPGYPRELEAIVLRAMAMDPMQRFPSADRLRIALEEWLARSGPIVTQTQVGALVRERLGTAIEDRRAQIRHLMQASGPGYAPHATQPSFPDQGEGSSSKISNPSGHGISHISSRSGAPTFTPPPQVGAARANSAASSALLGVGVGLGVFGVVVVGVAGWLLWHARHHATTPVATRPAVTQPAPLVAPPPSAATAAAPAPSASTPSVAAGIELHEVTPSSGVSFWLDGKALAPGKLVVTRPETGHVSKLIAEAKGYQRSVFTIDQGTPAELDVTLVKDAAPAPRPAAPRAATHRPVEIPHAASKPADSKPAIKPDIPANPFQ
jgi:eukaryotic-like serine/threonine-protein kinase